MLAPPQTTGHSPRGLYQQSIPGIVSECVIDLFEVVEVQKHQADFGFVPARLRQGELQPIHGEHPVGEAGQDVVIGLSEQLLFVTFADADVFANDQIAVDFAVCILDGGNHQLLPVPLAITPETVDFALPYANTLHLQFHPLPELPVVVAAQFLVYDR